MANGTSCFRSKTSLKELFSDDYESSNSPVPPNYNRWVMLEKVRLIWTNACWNGHFATTVELSKHYLRLL
jgi:hypothetical protein